MLLKVEIFWQENFTKDVNTYGIGTYKEYVQGEIFERKCNLWGLLLNKRPERTKLTLLKCVSAKNIIPVFPILLGLIWFSYQEYLLFVLHIIWSREQWFLGWSQIWIPSLTLFILNVNVIKSLALKEKYDGFFI